MSNARVVITRSTTTVRYFGDDYPFGWGMSGRSSNDINFRYGYQGQERDAETGYAAFELRMWTVASAAHESAQAKRLVLSPSHPLAALC